MYGKRCPPDCPLCSPLPQAPCSSYVQPGRTWEGHSGDEAIGSLCWTETPASGGSEIQDSSTRRHPVGQGCLRMLVGPQSEGLCLSRPPDGSAGGALCGPPLKPFPGGLPGSGLPKLHGRPCGDLPPGQPCSWNTGREVQVPFLWLQIKEIWGNRKETPGLDQLS